MAKRKTENHHTESKRASGAVPAPKSQAKPSAEYKSPYEEYAQSEGASTITGDLLKFTKAGEFVAGRYEDEVPLGKRLIAVMPSLCVGWVHWDGGYPIEHIMGPVGQGYRAVPRETLSPVDADDWPKDDEGKPRDPWQKTRTLILVDPEDMERLYTFSTSSIGGANALAELCKTFGKRDRMEPGKWQPVVELGRGSYQHPKREYGKIYTPTLKVVDWVPTSGLPPIDGMPDDGGLPPLPSPDNSGASAARPGF
jgi:hypothetical protein